MSAFSLEDKYTRTEGRIYVTASQALTRLPMLQQQRDAAAGLNTAGFISGYRGSPLGVYDLALWQAEDHLKRHNIHFEPGVNEDLAATAVWGSQQVGIIGESEYDGVFGLWYGKGPGVDRSGDALKHGNWAGSHPNGGVLALCGDDHAARSSTTAHQSDHALIHFGMPILNPASVQEYLDLGLFGFALSRYAGCWVGFKCVTDTAEASASVSIAPDRIQTVIPDDYALPEGGLNLQLGVMPLIAEQRVELRLQAAKAFVRANRLDKAIYNNGRVRLGIVSSGKAWLDVMDALAQLGIDEEIAGQLGIDIYKVAMVWPLEERGLKEFARRCEQLLIVEEKRPLIEEQIASLLYNDNEKPLLLGKRDASGKALISSTGELTPGTLIPILAARIALLEQAPADLRQQIIDRSSQLNGNCALPAAANSHLMRLPSFCAGCPHNTSTKVPEGSVAMGGIGCHGLATWLPERRTLALTHMGGEGAPWIGQAPFMQRQHIFQNLGDGTYFHSGLLAIRANVAANTNITYKILVNGAISMTGGQPIEGQSFDGGITAPNVAQQVWAEGVERIAIVSDDLTRHEERHRYPKTCTFHHRDELDKVQKTLREHKGVSVIVYEQACATERRRLRKRGKYPDTDRRLFIHSDVCEGCGDCGVQSNCIALEPEETSWGRKRRINQSVCNKDFSCVKGMCPSFVSVYGATPRKTESAGFSLEEGLLASLPTPQQSDDQDCNILIAGIGGSGIITLGALLGVAAHLEGKDCSVLDITGLAQRNGPVTSHIRFGSTDHKATRIPEAAVDLLLAADLVVASNPQVLPLLTKDRSAAVYNHYVAPTNAFASNADLSFDSQSMQQAVAQRCREGAVAAFDASGLATRVMGDAIAANAFLLGVAWQQGHIPLQRESLEQAILLNGVAVTMNQTAFQLGRLAVAASDQIATLVNGTPQTLNISTAESDEALYKQHLRDYQGPALAQRFEQQVQRIGAVETKAGGNGLLREAVASNYAKLLSYKDEYEVARLYSSKSFQQKLKASFEGDYRLTLHLAPPLLSRRDTEGRYQKREFGTWIFFALKGLARLKFLRGTAFDIFGYSKHRRMERQLISDYEALLGEIENSLSAQNLETAIKLAALPQKIRGFDHVKEANMAEYHERYAVLIAQYRGVRQ
jgi:indolepyruvate ferredoxin oxidoreductase